MAKTKAEPKIPNITDMVSAMSNKLSECSIDCEKFDNGNNAAGARIRKAIQEVRVMGKETRDAITEVKNNR